MNEIELAKYKNIINKKENKNNNLKKTLKNLLTKTVLTIIILLALAIIYKSDSNLKKTLSNYFFKETISFTQINKLYDKYLGGLLPIKKDNNITEVFNEKLNYSDLSIYHDGVRISVTENYLVPTLNEGMVVFVGEKENYGKTVIIENLDGVYFWYGNIYNTPLKLYDYVEKGDFIGEVSDTLYMVFSKDGEYLNYEEYIS